MRARTATTVLTGFAFLATAVNCWSDSADQKFLDLISVPTITSPQYRVNPVVIAIVDDGVRTSHQAIKAFVWTNNNEIPANGIDDDGNGYVDDIHGWDVSDNDAETSPPHYRADFYHGTHIAGIVTEVSRAAFGNSAHEKLRIMPVKAIADDDPTTYVKSGYAGIEYATQAGADIIIASWVVAHISPDEERVLQRAADAGVIVVGSSGNLPEEHDQYPAAHPTVLSVGSIEMSGEKTPNSTYGQFVDLSAPGSGIRSASIQSDDSYEFRSGTSFSAAMVAAAAAIVKLQHPSLSRKEVEACLKVSSNPIPIAQKELKGKTGAGALNVQGAVACDVIFTETADLNILTSPKGFLRANRRRGSPLAWSIEPNGEFGGVRFYPVADRKNSTDGRLEFRSEPSPNGKVLASYALADLPEQIFVPGSRAYVSFEPRKKRKRPDWLLEYEMETIDFSVVHCSGTTKIRSEGVLTDGSGPDDYSANSDCKWLITAPPGKVVRFTFEEMDTEPRTDMVYFFNGNGTHERIMAIFSGKEIPPELSTWSNEVLVWFVSNGQEQGAGWQARYQFVDPPQ